MNPSKTKIGAKCGEEKPLCEFDPTGKMLIRRYGLNRRCRACIPSSSRALRKRKRALRGDVWGKLRKEVLAHYGGNAPACACCSEDIVRFLTIDHIGGGGNEHARTVKGPLYRWIKKNNFPAGFRILSFNCNCAIAVNGGECPHQQLGTSSLPVNETSFHFVQGRTASERLLPPTIIDFVPASIRTTK